MHTIVAGLVLVLLFYAAQTFVVGWAFGWIVAVLYVLSLPLSATWDFRYADRTRRAVTRIRTYRLLRGNPSLRQQLLGEIAWLRGEAMALDAAIDRVPSVAQPGAEAAGSANVRR
jgi:hypothetical protein